MPSPSPACVADGCGRVEQLRRGFCNRHYKVWRRYGDPFGSAPPPVRTCAVPKCPVEGQMRQGMCEMHYRRWVRNGTAGAPGSVRIIGDDLKRFWSYVDTHGSLPEHVEWLGPCWNWTGYVDAEGYGKVQIKRHSTNAHRWSYEMFTGLIPEGLEVDHLCRNTGCVRPSHLEAVTTGENVRRRNYARAGKPWLSPRAPSS